LWIAIDPDDVELGCISDGQVLQHRVAAWVCSMPLGRTIGVTIIRNTSSGSFGKPTGIPVYALLIASMTMFAAA